VPDLRETIGTFWVSRSEHDEIVKALAERVTEIAAERDAARADLSTALGIIDRYRNGWLPLISAPDSPSYVREWSYTHPDPPLRQDCEPMSSDEVRLLIERETNAD